jgi:hypothetical protein
VTVARSMGMRAMPSQLKMTQGLGRTLVLMT